MIGALIIVAVIVVNWWQERRFHQQVTRSFTPLDSDALLDDPKIDTSKFETNSAYNSINDPAMDDFTFESVEPTHTFNDAINPVKSNALGDVSLNSEAADRFVKLNRPDAKQNNVIENISIDAAFSQLSNAISNGLSARELEANIAAKADSYIEAIADVKPAQHDDIKAIFDEAFSQTNKAATAYEFTPVEDITHSPPQRSN